tara:strand:- start:7130 stop:7684 length:555 start_codon:yes stop_codon:yes gene_type:complete
VIKHIFAPLKIKQMKVLIKIGVLAALVFSMNLANAQKDGKIGHINSNELLKVMPEKDTAEAELQKYAKELEMQLTAMTTEYEKKYTDYQANVNVMSDVIKASKEEEIMGIQRRIQDFQGKAQEALAKRESEIMEPIIKKARDAISKVAKDNGYSYVIDSGTGALLYFPEGQDILPLVKKELGIL